MNVLKSHFLINQEVGTALSERRPVLALESTIITHGMPYPENLSFARKAETLVRSAGVIPATVAVINGTIHIGINTDQLEQLASNNTVEKLSVRDIAYAIAQKRTGATTVSSTMRLAHLAGIEVFATGGIGGVHRNAENTFDISQDLIELVRTPLVVVSAGVKAILDIPKTLEYLETFSVPVIGYRTNMFPAFYSSSSGINIAAACNTPDEIVNLFIAHKSIKSSTAVLVVNPVPQKDEIPAIIIEDYVMQALFECERLNIKGKQVTPFLLKHVAELSGGQSLKTNISLALNNVALAAKIATCLCQRN